MTTGIAHIRNTSRCGIRRRVATLVMSVGLAFGVAPFVGSSSVSAAYPGVFNYAQCIPTHRAVIQDVEVYRSTFDEYVQLQGALVNTATGAPIYSQWAEGTGGTAHAAFKYANVPGGVYNVWYHWAVWNAASGMYVYSGWVQVTGAVLQTYGYETQPGIFLGWSTRHCAR